MKHLYLIGGTMGVGKTTVCRHLQKQLDRCVFLDGDWCWDMHPFIVNEETKAMVMENITFLLNQYIRCSVYKHILFCWVMHEQNIIEDLLSRIDTEDCVVHSISLTCAAEILTARLQKDIDAGIRQSDIIERSIARLPLYEKLNTHKIDTTHLDILQTAGMILEGTIKKH